jgi:hypothetical protein
MTSFRRRRFVGGSGIDEKMASWHIQALTHQSIYTVDIQQLLGDPLKLSLYDFIVKLLEFNF